METRQMVEQVLRNESARGWIMLGLMGIAILALCWGIWRERRIRKALKAELQAARAARRAENWALAVTPTCDVQERDGKLWYRMH